MKDKAIDGQANIAVIDLFCHELQIDQESIKIVRGLHRRYKTLLILNSESNAKKITNLINQK